MNTVLTDINLVGCKALCLYSLGQRYSMDGTLVCLLRTKCIWNHFQKKISIDSVTQCKCTITRHKRHVSIWLPAYLGSESSWISNFLCLSIVCQQDIMSAFSAQGTQKIEVFPQMLTYFSLFPNPGRFLLKFSWDCDPLMEKRNPVSLWMREFIEQMRMHIQRNRFKYGDSEWNMLKYLNNSFIGDSVDSFAILFNAYNL